MDLSALREIEKKRAATIFLLALFGIALGALAVTLAEVQTIRILQDRAGVSEVGRCLTHSIVSLSVPLQIANALLGVAGLGSYVIAKDLEKVRLWRVIVYGSMFGIVLSILLLVQIMPGSDKQPTFAAMRIVEARCHGLAYDGGLTAATDFMAKAPGFMLGLIAWFVGFLVVHVGVKPFALGTQMVDPQAVQPARPAKPAQPAEPAAPAASPESAEAPEPGECSEELEAEAMVASEPPETTEPGGPVHD